MRAFLSWILPAVATFAAWWLFLGTDENDNYSVLQVAGLVVVLIVIGIAAGWLARSSELLGVIVSAVVGVAAACWASWSDDESGLFVVGWGMVVFGTVLSTVLVVMITSAFRQSRQRRDAQP
ncbi:hypothetical protein [Aeromicrobium choanae]|uniref:Uncharacterized protein n=1 Tax=Aeromicrobium choanae TaxID=1736691 RepID=A0A1T4YLQ0_9ACTN|nr:hypothetical protein [Aeromicrobium choanae]SKB02757.1 hypothetical protein SAMN06295964_0048 [Aeromicrobium choanae]